MRRDFAGEAIVIHIARLPGLSFQGTLAGNEANGDLVIQISCEGLVNA